ncbi:SAF domain-containing protein [Nocardioides marmoriginsengisoli]|uniref:SAF domain-containing protein n=1 Tax=Nocardioides marmoriginsengisoli TaxID=661483 RepID=UPI0016157553|nr:SAF domain-containing protein [Nocardioides marmoriginsengisoli]
MLFVLVAVLVAGWLWQQKSDKQEVLAVVHAVPAGSVITSDDLKVIEVAGLKDSIAAADLENVKGSTAAVGLVAGQVLTPGVVAANPMPGKGERVVGLDLDATRAPTGLQAGDVVMVLAVPPAGDASGPAELESPTVLAEVTTVLSADHIEGAGTRLTLVVAQNVAARVASFGAAGRVALVQMPLGGDN